jgi:hypothetical protein
MDIFSFGCSEIKDIPTCRKNLQASVKGFYISSQNLRPQNVHK